MFPWWEGDDIRTERAWQRCLAVTVVVPEKQTSATWLPPQGAKMTLLRLNCINNAVLFQCFPPLFLILTRDSNEP